MNPGSKILLRVFVRAFYVENASFFLIGIGITCGFMSSVEHKALAEFFVSNLYTSLVPLALWMIYGLKIHHFNLTVMRKNENLFLHNLILFPFPLRLSLITVVLLNQLLPVIVYGFFILAMAATLGKSDAFVTTALGLLFLFAILIFRFHSKMLRANYERPTLWLDRIFNQNFVRPYVVFAIEWVCRKRTLSVLSIKAFCLLLIMGVLALYQHESYDARLLNMTLVIVLSINAPLIAEAHAFENIHFSIVRQLPFTLLRRVRNVLPFIVFIFFPELSLLLTRFPVHLPVWDRLQVVLMTFCFAVSLYGLLYRKNTDQNKFQQRLFAVCMASVVLILFGVPLWIFSGIFAVVGFWCWVNYYYCFEGSADTQ